MDSVIASTTTDFRYSLSGLTSFFSGSTGAQWGVIASDALGSTTFSGFRFMASVADDSTVATPRNSAIKTAANLINTYANTVDGTYTDGPWPLTGTDAGLSDPANPLATGGPKANLGITGLKTVGDLVDGAQLFSWEVTSLGTSGSAVSSVAPVRYGNWTLDLDTNTITYTNETTEYAKLGTSGWFDAKSSETSWYVTEHENVTLSGTAVVTESYAYINGVKADTLTGVNNLTGGSAGDTLIGNAAGNALVGNGGADVLSGLGGFDTLTGGTGEDQFWFGAALNGSTNVDSITDFEGAGLAGGDVIALDDAIFTVLSGTTDFTGVFQSGPSDAAGAAGIRLIYNSTSGALFYDQDGDGAGAAVQFATLNGAPALAASDFLMV